MILLVEKLKSLLQYQDTSIYLEHLYSGEELYIDSQLYDEFGRMGNYDEAEKQSFKTFLLVNSHPRDYRRLWDYFNHQFCPSSQDFQLIKYNLLSSNGAYKEIEQINFGIHLKPNLKMAIRVGLLFKAPTNSQFHDAQDTFFRPRLAYDLPRPEHSLEKDFEKFTQVRQQQYEKIVGTLRALVKSYYYIDQSRSYFQKSYERVYP